MKQLCIALGLAVISPLVLAQTASKPDPAKAQKIASEVCAACHNADGNSAIAANPKLAGQHFEYLVKQLHDFKPKDGKPAERANPVMAGFAGSLSDDDIRNLAAYYSAQKLKPAVARSKDLVETAEHIYRGGIASKGVPACAGCHSPNGAGLPAQYPRLGGQWADYTKEQLISFRQGKRKNNSPMAEIASRLSDAEIDALSDYIAGLR